ncbi:MAG: excisionase family DNA-binding protein, partial [Planctomycetota bacterium]
MASDQRNLLTTGRAAELCSVTADTILKWIKRGRLSGVRTAGGHYRIDSRSLEPFIAGSRFGGPECPSPDADGGHGGRLRCWEYLSDGGEVRERCRQCVVYRVRADRCYLMAEMEEDVGHARQFCETSCEDCAYYRHVKGLAPYVLVVTSDDEFIDELSGQQGQSIAMRFARTGYEASALIQDFRPAFAVIDAECMLAEDTELLDALAADPRVPGLRVMIAVPSGTPARSRGRWKSDLIVSVLEKPFGGDQIADVI